MAAEPADDQQQQEEEEEEDEEDIDGEPDKDDNFDNKQEEPEPESESETEPRSEPECEDENSSSSDNEDPEKKAEERKNPELHFRRFKRALESRWVKKQLEKEERTSLLNDPENIFDFPRDRENWREQDIGELWADAPLRFGKTGWDPAWADDEDIDITEELVRDGEDPPIAPFYLPYRKYYPAIPDNHYDISNPKSVIEELDRIEEFLMWASYIFPGGSSYEGTVWDDLAHGKGVYVAEEGLVRYEGEWLHNDMEGHGVVEVEIPDVEPVPGSKLEAKMRKEGRIITRDFMTPEDKEWLEMDVEDSVLLADGIREVPFYQREGWIRIFGNKPEKGRYRYAGQWKHGRMHGCGVYEVNERIIYGRFYFGQHVEDSVGCDSDVSALHAGIAEVAAAKARMFINKPDGMVREERGPYGDPQHPYFYEEDDAWMAPGFVHQFYEVPDYWKTYAEEVDQEREMWLNSFYKAPLRIPMPAELEHWWSRDPGPEFILVNKEPEPDPEDPSKLIYTEDPLIIHTPTGRVINYVEDEEHGVRLFWQPDLTEGEDVDPEKAEFLPLGFDEFYGRATPSEKKQSILRALITSVGNAVKPLFDRLEKWVEEKKKASELNRNLIEQELEFIEAEICLEETLEDMENELKMEQKEEEKKAASEQKEEEKKAASEKRNDQVSGEAGEDEAESEDEDEDDGAPTSFGTVQQQETDKSEKKPGKSPFSSLTLSLTTPGLISMVPSKLQDSFVSWRAARHQSFARDLSCGLNEELRGHQRKSNSVMFPHSFSGRRANLKAVVKQSQLLPRRNSGSQLKPLARIISSQRKCEGPQMGDHGSSSGASCKFSILSMHVPVDICTLA